jgi:hypothetical protein
LFVSDFYGFAGPERFIGSQYYFEAVDGVQVMLAQVHILTDGFQKEFLFQVAQALVAGLILGIHDPVVLAEMPVGTSFGTMYLQGIGLGV